MNTITIKLPDSFDAFIRDQTAAGQHGPISGKQMEQLRQTYAIGLLIATLHGMGIRDLADAVAQLNGCPVMKPFSDPSTH